MTSQFFNRIPLLAVMALFALNGCASRTATLGEWDNHLEKNNYESWEPSDYNMRPMLIDYKYNVPVQLSVKHSKDGSASFKEDMEVTLGLEVHDYLYASSAFVGDITPTRIVGTFLGVNSDAPNFGTEEYGGQITYQRSMKNMAYNYGLLTHEEPVDINSLELGGQNAFHNLHIYTKQLFTGRRLEIIETMASNQIDCQLSGYDAESDNYFRIKSTINPLKQYSEFYICTASNDRSYNLMSKSLVLKNEDNSYNVMQLLSIYNIEDSSFMDELLTDLYSDHNWTTQFTTARDIPELDRKLVIKSKNQPHQWTEEYPKGSLYQ